MIQALSLPSLLSLYFVLTIMALYLIPQHFHWPYFALVGGGSYVYFPGRNLTTHLQ